MKPFVKVSLKYGLLAGFIGPLLMIGLYNMNRHPFLIPVFLDSRIILFGVFIFFTLKEIRDYYQGGILYFWQGIFASFLFTVAFAVVGMAALAAFMGTVPEFLSSYVSLSMQQLRSLPEEVIARIGKEVYAYSLETLPGTKTSDLLFLFFWQSFTISLFISIILSVILRRQPKT
jgi:hypothetical protein